MRIDFVLVKRILAMAAVMLVFSSCSIERTKQSELKIDSAHSIGIDGVVSNGVIFTRSRSNAAIDRQIRTQFKYLTGQLNGINGGADLNRLQISINEKIPGENGLTEVHYAAKVLVAWQKDLTLPSSYEVILPAGGDGEAQDEFFEAFKETCTSDSAHDMSSGAYWYDYRPKSAACQTAMQDPAFLPLVARFPMTLSLSTENTNGKSPEYEKIWEDNRVVVTAVFGKYEDGATSNRDAGIAAYNEFYRTLSAIYGEPSFQDYPLPSGQSPGINNPAINMIFNSNQGQLDVQILLIDGILSADEAFRQRYNERTRISDLVSYNGHSGLGANIRALARMGSFQSGQYQLFFVNGCDTFAYVDNALREAHAAANPGSAPSKYFDIITNAMPSYFNSNSENNMALIEAFLTKTKTYRQLLSGFDRDQRAVVTGEEDNAWPEKF